MEPPPSAPTPNSKIRTPCTAGVIDGIVEGANKKNADMEKLAADRDASISYVVWGVSAAVLALIAGGLAFVALGVVRPIVRMTGAMQQLATGDLTAEVPDADPSRRSRLDGERTRGFQAGRAGQCQAA